MSLTKSRKRVYWLVFSLLALAMMACRIEMPRIVMEEDTPTPNVIVITQVATQIITATPAPPVLVTQVPTELPGPTLTPTWDPLAAPIYYPLEGCVASRLKVGTRAMVSYVGGANGIRYGLDMQYDTIAVYAEPGEVLEIIGGPWCSHGWIVWMVRTATGFVGYTPEGDGNSYWLLPMAPGS